MTPVEERLAVLETKVQDMREGQDEIKAKLEQLVTIADMGKGALWFAIKAGAWILGIVAIGKFALDLFNSIMGKH